MSSDILTSLRHLLANPASNPRAAVLLFAIVAILVMVLVIMIVLLLLRRRERAAWAEWNAWEAENGRFSEEQEGVDAHPAPTRDPEEYEYPELSHALAPTLPSEVRGPLRRRSVTGHLLRAGGLWIALVAVLTAVAFGYVTSGTTAFCVRSCHAADESTALYRTDAHGAVGCVRCHEDPPSLGAGGTLITRSVHLLQVWDPALHSYDGPVPSYRCLECHADIANGIVVVDRIGVRMDHARPLAAGMSCDDCHTHTGHRSPSETVRMSACMSCHDGRAASSRCASCHTKDVGLLSRTSERLFARTGLPAKADCGTCHKLATCDACHGIRLPHPPEFTGWQHASAAAFTRKATCERCHAARDCLVCHGEFTGARASHGPIWRSTHADSPFSSQCSCHWSRLPETGRTRGSYCAVCHPAGRPTRATPRGAGTSPATRIPSVTPAP
jgi:hypothetical protein